MKSRVIQFLSASIFFLLVSCTKEVSKEKGSGTLPGNSSFRATIDGTLWNADSLQLVQVGGGGVTISGLSKTGEEISMLVPLFKTGTYPLSIKSVSFALYVNLLGNISKLYVSNKGTASGSITISSIDTVHRLVNGSFQFTLVDPSDNSVKTISKGVFTNLSYTVSGSSSNPPPGVAVDTLQAKIDSNLFFAATVQTYIRASKLFISGLAADGTKNLTLIMPSTITAGTYNFSLSSGVYTGIYIPNTTEALVSESSGLLTILSNDPIAKKIRGNFSFHASSFYTSTVATISAGYFSVNY